jgi:hypothetical protein
VPWTKNSRIAVLSIHYIELSIIKKDFMALGRTAGFFGMEQPNSLWRFGRQKLINIFLEDHRDSDAMRRLFWGSVGEELAKDSALNMFNSNFPISASLS